MVLPTPRLTRTLLRRGPVSHLSKSEVNGLADRGAVLGHSVKLLTYPEKLGFLTTHSGADFGWGRSGDLCTCSVTRLRLYEHSKLDGATKEDGPVTWS